MTDRTALRALLGAVALATAVVLAAPAPLVAQEAAVAVEELPAATDILARYVEAVGGRDAILARKSLHGTGTFSMPSQGIEGKLETFAAAPNLYLVKVEVPGLGNMATGFDGTTGWMVQPMTGPMVLEGKALDELKFEADFYELLKDPAKFASIETVGMQEIDGAACYKVRLSKGEGHEVFEFYHPETGLMVAREAKQETPMGAVDVFTTILEHKQFGDLMLPAAQSQKMMGMEQKMTFESFTFDEIDPAVFALPEEIQALVEEPAAKP